MQKDQCQHICYEHLNISRKAVGCRLRLPCLTFKEVEAEAPPQKTNDTPVLFFVQEE